MSKTLKRLGAEVVEIELATDGIDMDFILHHDFKASFNAYLANEDAPIKSLSELIEYNQKDEAVRAKYGQDLLIKTNQTGGGKQAEIEYMVTLAQKRINQVMEDKKLEVIAFAGPSGVLLSAVAGYPEISVPLGVSVLQESVGATFVARANEEQKLVNLAYQFEQLTKARLIPTKYYESSVSP